MHPQVQYAASGVQFPAMPAKQLRCEVWVIPEGDQTGERAIECGAIALASAFSVVVVVREASMPLVENRGAKIYWDQQAAYAISTGGVSD